MSIKLRYFIYGFLFGLCFPAMAIALQMILSKLPFSIHNIGNVHDINPLIYMIDSAPLFLGIFAFIGGVSKQKSVVLLEEFKVLAENLNESNKYLQIHSDFIFKDLLSSTDEIKLLTQEILHSNENLYEHNTENKNSASHLVESSNQLLSYTSDLINLNKVLKASNDQTFEEVHQFRQLLTGLSDNIMKTYDIGIEIKTLAINSSIEANHYGESGKSFTVISNQIKTLSDFISNLNTKTQDVTTSVNRQIEKIFAYVKDQNIKLQNIAALIAEIEKSANVNKGNLNEIALNIDNSIEIQDNQKLKFNTVSAEIEQMSNEKLNLIEGLKQVIEKNTQLITRISSL